MEIECEITIAPKTPVDLSREQFTSLACELVEEQILLLPATLIGGQDLETDERRFD